MDKISEIKTKFNKINHSLDERSRSLWAASEAISIGRGGITIVFKAIGLAKTTISRGIMELETGRAAHPKGKIRKIGGGRKRLENIHENLLDEIEALVDPETRGDPESPLRWTTKSTRNISNTLKTKGIKISHEKVSKLLKLMGYSLQAPRKTNEGKSHPDRDQQFRYINMQTVEFQSQGFPVVSIDAKKKELVGRFTNNGKEYQPTGKPEEVDVYDFPSLAKGRVTPYGIYDITHNAAWVNVGISKDTAQFAVSTLRNWWTKMGSKLYPLSQKLLIHADGGGSNGSRNRLWKCELQTFATEYNLEITVSHFPPGTSKWNKIEHRLFSQITKNWRGKPLESLEVIINLIGSTSTNTGLVVNAAIDSNEYEGGIKIADKKLSQINIVRHEFHGNDWNYTIKPLK
jgi:transposase